VVMFEFVLRGISRDGLLENNRETPGKNLELERSVLWEVYITVFQASVKCAWLYMSG
jgi:hypothetical protein